MQWGQRVRNPCWGAKGGDVRGLGEKRLSTPLFLAPTTACQRASLALRTFSYVLESYHRTVGTSHWSLGVTRTLEDSDARVIG